nr:membrane protein insertion efficiency factor YidD [Nakamurella alba]
MAWLLIAPIRFYQRFITPYTPATCRYYPTCSTYAVTALREHGAFKGSWLTVRRLGRCHPWSDGGIDHVPPRRERSGAHGSSTSVDPMGTTCEHGASRGPVVAGSGGPSIVAAASACGADHHHEAPSGPGRSSPSSEKSTAA